jgi:surface polysaccharide O-acyltransferase-like enzyme
MDIQSQNSITNNRNFQLDILRVLACLLVIWQHSSEFFYIAPNGDAINCDASYNLAWLNSFARTSVPLFVMISGFFLLPMKCSTSVFFKKRFTRIVYPFLAWCVAYAFYFMLYRGDSLAGCLKNIANIPINFGTDVGHLWYIYMLIGLYLITPVISPWLEKCSKNEMRAFLGIWLVTTLLPYIHLAFPALLGECYWNDTPTLYYFTGFIGYFILGHYVRKYGFVKTYQLIAILAIGYVMSALIFSHQLGVTSDCGKVELSWGFNTINVVMMTYAVFGLVSKIKTTTNEKVAKIFMSMSLYSFAIYLVHVMILNCMHDEVFDGIDNVFIAVPCLTLSTFIIGYAVTKLLSYIPTAHYWLGTYKSDEIQKKIKQ